MSDDPGQLAKRLAESGCALAATFGVKIYVLSHEEIQLAYNALVLAAYAPTISGERAMRLRDELVSRLKALGFGD